MYDETGRKYTIFIRQHSKFPDNFSVGLRYTFPQRSSSINLRRYNSKQIHRNTLEKQKIFGYHVHIATEKYQMAERKPEGYAEISEKFSNPREAFACLVKDCNLIRPESESMPLLELTNEK